MTDPLDAAALASHILSIPGVTEIFPPTGTASLLGAIASGLADPKIGEEHCLAVSKGPDGSALSARIGVARTSPAPETGRTVADALLAAEPDATVTVQITRIA